MHRAPDLVSEDFAPHPQFTKVEVSYWLDSLRHEVMHADRRPTYARSPDIEPFLGRIEWAAYDVLFNKEEWRSRRPDRRRAVAFDAVVKSGGSGLILRRQSATVLLDWMDPFKRFPIDWTARVNIPPPWHAVSAD